MFLNNSLQMVILIFDNLVQMIRFNVTAWYTCLSLSLREPQSWHVSVLCLPLKSVGHQKQSQREKKKKRKEQP